MTRAARRAQPRTALDAARQTAYDALRSVDQDDAYLNLVLPRLLSERGLSGRDAGLATELANGTARLQGSYDAFLESCVTGGITNVQPAVLTALRLGVHQLLSMRVPAHAAVGTSVELVRTAVGERPVRLVNAVLRKVATKTYDEWVEATAPARSNDLVGHLAVRHSHPRWIVQAYLDVLSDLDAVEALLIADNVAPTVTLAARPGLCSIDELCAADATPSKGLADGTQKAVITPARWSPYAAQLSGGDPAQLAVVRAGRAGVQDEGSQLAALAACRVPLTGRDSRWLDLCAGPGGKAALLTGLARAQRATLVASDSRLHRAQLVSSAVRAYPLPHPVVAADGRQPPWRPSTFDRVIVDVPCSGLGALRRRPDARWRRRQTDVEQLVPLQVALLQSALDSARPGGVVTYITCSPHFAETRGVVDSVLNARSDGVQEDVRPLFDQLPHLGPGPHLQLWPHLHGTDAMFIASLRRRG